MGAIWHDEPEISGMGEALLGQDYRSRHGMDNPECRKNVNWMQGWTTKTAPEQYFVLFVCLYKGEVTACKPVARGDESFCERYVANMQVVDIPSLVPEREIVSKMFRVMAEFEYAQLSAELERFGGHVQIDPSWN